MQRTDSGAFGIFWDIAALSVCGSNAHKSAESEEGFFSLTEC